MVVKNVDANIIKIDTEYKRELICPYCGHEQDTQTMYEFVTTWGDSGEERTCECEDCGKTFIVEEHVSRSFTTTKLSIPPQAKASGP